MTCEICDYVKGRVKIKKLYEDEDIIAMFNPKPSVFGHAIVVPKGHFTILPQVPDSIAKKMFFVAQQIAGIIFETVGAEGSNIMVNEGVAAGQTHAHAILHIIPRKPDDGLNFEWPQKQIPEDSMNKIHELLKIPEEAMQEEVEEKKEEPPQIKEETVKKEKPKDYLLEHWTRRIP